MLAEHVQGLLGGTKKYIQDKINPKIAMFQFAPASVVKGENWKYQQINKPTYQIEAMRRVYPLNNLTWRKYGKTPQNAAENYNNFITNIVTKAAKQKVTSEGAVFLTHSGWPNKVFNVRENRWQGLPNQTLHPFNPTKGKAKGAGAGGDGTEIGKNKFYTTGSGNTTERKWTQSRLNDFGNPNSKKFMSGLEKDFKDIGPYKQSIGPDTTLSGSAGVFTHGTQRS